MKGGEVFNVTIDGAKLRRHLFGVVLAMLRVALRLVCTQRFNVDVDVKLSPTASTDRFLDKVTTTGVIAGLLAAFTLFSMACATTGAVPTSSSAPAETTHRTPHYTEEASASASAKPEVIAFQVPLEAAQQVPAAALGFTVSWTTTCTTSPTTIVPVTAGNVIAFQCTAVEASDTGAATLIEFGGSNLADPASGTRNGPVICGSGCNRTSVAINAKNGKCRAGSGSVPIYCWGVVPTDTQP